jgi:ABC-2 type transport system permease protein
MSDNFLKNNKRSPGLFSVSMREWRRFRADVTQKILLLVIAPVICWFFCALYGDGTIRNIPVAIYDADHSALSRTIARSINATKLMNIVAYVDSKESLEHGIASGAYAAGFFLPPGLEADAKAGRCAQPVLFRNGTNYLVASYIAREGLSVIRTINAGIVISRLRKSGMGRRQALALVSPIGVDISNVYNPAFSYLHYFSPGIIFAQFGMIVMISAAMCFAHERQRVNMPQLRFRASNNITRALHGKSAIYLTVVLALAALILWVLFPLYSVATPMESLSALPSVLLYIAACWWMGALAGTITASPLLSAEIGIFLGMPAFIFSGWTFPLEAVPGVMVALANVLPFTHFMPAWFATARMGNGAFFPLHEQGILAAVAAGCYLLTYVIYHLLWKKPYGNRSPFPINRYEGRFAESGEVLHG